MADKQKRVRRTKAEMAIVKKKELAKAKRDAKKAEREAVKEQARTTAARKAMLEAMESTMCNISESVRKAGIARNTHYEWMKNDPSYKQAIHDLTERNLDFAESMLMRNIKNGKETSTIFYLKTRAKQRGYIETTINVNTDAVGLDTLSDDDLLKIAMGKSDGIIEQ
jgi:hypothetical protein